MHIITSGIFNSIFIRPAKTDYTISTIRSCSYSMDENNNKRSLSNEKQRDVRLKIGCEKDRARRRTRKTTRGKEKVVRNRRPRETAPGHSEKIKAR